MIIKLSNYDGIYRVVSLAKDYETKECLEKNGLESLYLSGSNAYFLPDGKKIKLDTEELFLLNDSCNYDVFEISKSGNAYKYYDNKSLDNAVLVTNKCNSNCIMCPTSDYVRKGMEEYNASSLIKIAKHFPCDAPHITITGGEPFLIRKEMFYFLSFLKQNLPSTEYLLLTNGRAFCRKEYVELFVQNTPPIIRLGIPLHGHNSKLHDSVVRSKGAFTQTYTGLKHLLATGVTVELRIVVSKLNADSITKIAKLITEEFNSVFCVKIIGLEMTGNAAKNKKDVWIGYPDAFKKSKAGIDLMISHGIDVGLYNFPLCAVEKEYWNICEKSISDFKIRYAPECNLCKVKDACGGIFSGTIRIAKSDINPITII